MSTRVGIESKLFRGYWDDGLLDLFSGVGVLAIGISWAFHLVPLGALVPAVLIPFWNPIRRALIEPRAGHVEFSDVRVHKVRRWGVTAFWLGVGTLGLGILVYFLVTSGTVPRPSRYIAALPALLIALMAIIAGLGLGLNRFLLYALVLAVCGFGVAIYGLEPEVAMTAGGLVAALGGTWRLMRFLREESQGEGGADEST